MPRPLRPIADGLVYHVISRANGRQSVFCRAGGDQAFRKAMAGLKERKSFEPYGNCLMTNHIHLLLRLRAVAISRIVHGHFSVRKRCWLEKVRSWHAGVGRGLLANHLNTNRD